MRPQAALVKMQGVQCLGAFLTLGLCLAAGTALAEPDVFELGNGQHGDLRVQQMGVVINTATALTAEVTADSKTLTVADATGFAAGELVLVLQVYAEGPAPEAGTAGPLDLGASGAGHWELARLESVAPNALNLTAPLVSSFPAPGSQVVRVPEYTSVHVLPSASLVAPPWDGSSGGVLVFLASGSVQNQGMILADGAGFRGGTFAVSPGQNTGCAELNQSQATGGAQKGEGVFSLAPGAPTHGYGALANGGGGGNCDDGGGGGGGHGGAGGQGGYTASTDGSRDVGGRGGLALIYSPLTRMLFGGGGGAGAGSSGGPAGKAGSSGGAGGGIIYIRSRDFQGTQGVVHANGKAAADALNDAAGGGGAGGHITLRVKSGIDCAGIEVNGGAGGSNTDVKAHGPGGGGGGGVVVLQGQTLTCAASEAAGLAGSAAGTTGGGSYGATPITASQPENQGTTTTVTEGFALPSAPVWVSPAEGEETGPRPQLQGTAQPGSSVQVLLDGKALGTVKAGDDGTFTLQLDADLALGGPYELRAFAERLGLRSSLSDPRSFTVGTLSPKEFSVGCGCGSAHAPGSGWLALGVLMLCVWSRGGRPAVRRGALARGGCPGVHVSLQAPATLPEGPHTVGRADGRG